MKNVIKIIFIALFLIQGSIVVAQSIGNQDFTGRENHFAPRRLEVDMIRIEQGVFERPTVFESWRSIYWVKPNAGFTAIKVFVTAANGLSVDFRQDGVNKMATANNGVFSSSFETNNGKAMTEIEIIVSDGVNERSYYLDVCRIDPQRHDVVVNYYGLQPYPQTHNATRVLVDQIMYAYTITQKRIEFIANYFVGSQKNLKQLIDPVKALNPNWQSLHYHLSIWNNDKAEIIIDNKWSHSEWDHLINELFVQDPYIFMYAINKNTGKTTWLQDLTYFAYLMNISNENYYRFLVDNLEYQCNSTGYNSVFFDSFAMGVVYSFTEKNYINYGAGDNVPQQFTQYKNPQLGGLTWLQASEEFISRMNKDMNKRGIWLLPNHGNMTTSWDPLDYALTNGGMLEGVPMRPDNSRAVSDPNYLLDWIQSISRTMYLTQKDRVIILQPSIDNVNNLNYRLFVIGEYLMVREKYSYINLNVSGQAQASWYPEYEIDLGAPVQTYIIPDTLFTPRKESIDKALLNYREGDLFIRRFEKGMVILNPHNTTRQYTIPSDRAYKSAVIAGGGTVPESGIEGLTYSLSWAGLPSGSVQTLPAVSALIIRSDYIDTGQKEVFYEKTNVYAAGGSIYISCDASNTIKEVSVYNMQGMLLYKTSAIEATSHIVELNQPAGMYIVRVVSAKDTEEVKVFYKP